MICTDPLQCAAVTLADFPASAAIGTAAATVDITSVVLLAQNTPGIAVTIPTPTAGAAAGGQSLTIVNTGTNAVLVSAGGSSPNVSVIPGAYTDLIFDGSLWNQSVGAQSGRYPFASPTGSLVLTTGNYVVNCVNGAAAVTITLPSAVQNGGRIYIIKRFVGSTGTVTIASVSGLIQSTAGTSAATTTLAALGTYGQHQQFISDGAAWVRLN